MSGEQGGGHFMQESGDRNHHTRKQEIEKSHHIQPLSPPFAHGS